MRKIRWVARAVLFYKFYFTSFVRINVIFDNLHFLTYYSFHQSVSQNVLFTKGPPPGNPMVAPVTGDYLVIMMLGAVKLITVIDVSLDTSPLSSCPLLAASAKLQTSLTVHWINTSFHLPTPTPALVSLAR